MVTRMQEPYPVTHSWHVNGLRDARACAMFKARMQETGGVLETEVDASHDKVVVTYDLRRVTADQIETAMADSTIAPAGGLLPALERQWIHYTEKNERDSLSFVPRSFNSLPH